VIARSLLTSASTAKLRVPSLLVFRIVPFSMRLVPAILYRRLRASVFSRRVGDLELVLPEFFGLSYLSLVQHLRGGEVREVLVVCEDLEL
jgi:hypothetical protein